MSDELFVPQDFAVPDGLTAEEFRLAPLGPQHNEADYAALSTGTGDVIGCVYIYPARAHPGCERQA